MAFYRGFRVLSFKHIEANGGLSSSADPDSAIEVWADPQPFDGGLVHFGGQLRSSNHI